LNHLLNEVKTIRDHSLFRTILMAMSHPGSVYPVPELEDETDPVTCLLGCMMDNEVGFAVIGNSDLEARLAKQTCGRPAPVDDADFIIAPKGSTHGAIDRFKRGTLEYPDKGATVVYLVEALGYGNISFTLSGPGVDGETDLDIAGFDYDELRWLREVNTEFPLGVDALFMDSACRIAAIPRSSQIGVD